MEIKNFNNEKSIKINCSFCGKEIECPESMIEKSKKHMCSDCFNNKGWNDKEIKDVHVDIPMGEFPDTVASTMADQMIEKMFPEMWSGKKLKLKEMSKKELAKEMLGAGVYLGIKAFMESMQEAEKEQNNKIKDEIQ